MRLCDECTAGAHGDAGGVGRRPTGCRRLALNSRPNTFRAFWRIGLAENWYAGACHICRCRVGAREGRRVNVDGCWVTCCHGCEPVTVAPPAGDHDGWHRGPMAALDLETTGLDPAADRVVTAAIT